MSGRGDRRRARGDARTRGWTWAGLTALALATLALVGYAALGPGRPTPTGTPIPIDAFATAPPIAPAPDPSASPSPPPPAPLELPVEQRLIAGVDARTAYRTETIDCPAAGDAVLQTTSDGGASWTDHTVTGASGLRSLSPYTDTRIVAGTVTLPDCRIDFWRSFTSGAGWASQPGARADAVVVDPVDPGRVLRMAGRVTTPCDAVAAGALAADGGMAVICTDAVLHTSPAGDAKAWTAAELPGEAVAVTAAAGDYLVALRRDADCPGLALVTLRASGTVRPAACLGDLGDETEPVALGGAIDGTLWLWVGDAVATSTDRGKTWSGIA